jgi:RNA polymerase sigma-70 factor (ECF subfamily)
MGPIMLEESDLAALFEVNADFVWRSVRRLGVPEAWADDATQQVFVVAQKKITTIVAGRERAFLFRVAINVAAHVRRAAARRREVLGADEGELVDDTPLQDVALDQRRARALLDEVLDALELDLRTVFVLCELEEMTMADVATMLDLPPGTVASRLRRARAAFHAEAQRARIRNQKVARQTEARPSQALNIAPAIREAAR